ncbi:MAG TPA: hypothetical protein VH722_21905 [Alphaproteobacteria bacterium]|nr:hypothetical protein [Alphaproteobacteria bacterium]
MRGWSSLFARAAAKDSCGTCRHFRNDPAYLEEMFKGLTSFSSGYASVRGDDGLCAEHDLYLSPTNTCPRYAARAAATAAELSTR